MISGTWDKKGCESPTYNNIHNFPASLADGLIEMFNFSLVNGEAWPVTYREAVNGAGGRGGIKTQFCLISFKWNVIAIKHN